MSLELEDGTPAPLTATTETSQTSADREWMLRPRHTTPDPNGDEAAPSTRGSGQSTLQQRHRNKIKNKKDNDIRGAAIEKEIDRERSKEEKRQTDSTGRRQTERQIPIGM